VFVLATASIVYTFARDNTRELALKPRTYGPVSWPINQKISSPVLDSFTNPPSPATSLSCPLLSLLDVRLDDGVLLGLLPCSLAHFTDPRNTIAARDGIWTVLYVFLFAVFAFDDHAPVLVAATMSIGVHFAHFCCRIR
jgi:hypothetical protein